MNIKVKAGLKTAGLFSSVIAVAFLIAFILHRFGQYVFPVIVIFLVGFVAYQVYGGFLTYEKEKEKGWTKKR